MSSDQAVQFLGGPVSQEDFDLNGVWCSALRRHQPPYFCHHLGDGDVWEHYAAGTDAGVYIYMGHCVEIPHQFGYPHDHGLDGEPF